MSTLFDLLVCGLFARTSHYRFPHAVDIAGSGTERRLRQGPLTSPTPTAEHAGVLDDVKPRPGTVD